MIVVSDTSPLNYLTLIDQSELLHLLFGQVIVPTAVADELAAAAAPESVRRLINCPPEWLSIQQPHHLDSTLPRLGKGEVEAISLDQELRADLLLCDDADARRAAAQRGIRVSGTLGVLEAGAAKGYLNFANCVEQLRKTTLRIPESILARMLRDDAARKQR